jgi:hypothetical protein
VDLLRDATSARLSAGGWIESVLVWHGTVAPEGQLDPCGRSTAWRALQPQPTIVGEHNSSCDGEPKACTSAIARPDLPETIEYMSELILIHARTRVMHTDPDSVSAHMRINSHQARRGRELHRIADKIAKRLDQSILIRIDRHGIRRHINTPAERSLLCEYCE